MKLGDTLSGYRIVSEPTNVGGGMSQWAFAEKQGRAYFVKMFLAPKFPLPDAPGSAESKARKLERCLAFEKRHLEIAERLHPTAPGAGNLVVPVDFFRVDATYVKVMERVAATPLPPAHELTGHQILVILRTLAFSIRLLHDQGIVHGDIKPDNALVEQTEHGLFITKLIDFDEAYLAGEPPPPDDVVGDPSYYPPELLRYIKGDPAVRGSDLTTRADMFALGLLVHRFLVGDSPIFDRSWAAYPCEALVAGDRLDTSRAPGALRELLDGLLAVDPSHRPTIHEVVDHLRTADGDQLVPSEPIEPATAAAVGRLRSTSVRSGPVLVAPDAPPPVRSTIRGSVTGTTSPPSTPLRSTMGRSRIGPGDTIEPVASAQAAPTEPEEAP